MLLEAPREPARPTAPVLAEPSTHHAYRREGLGTRVLPFAAVRALALMTGLLPFATVHLTPLLLAAGLTAVIVATALTVPWDRLPPVLHVAPPLLYLVVIAILREGGGGVGSGYSPLVMLPVLWTALYGSRVELYIVFGGVVALLFGPILLIGPPHYPVHGVRAGVLSTAVAAVIAYHVRALVDRCDRSPGPEPIGYGAGPVRPLP